MAAHLYTPANITVQGRTKLNLSLGCLVGGPIMIRTEDPARVEKVGITGIGWHTTTCVTRI